MVQFKSKEEAIEWAKRIPAAEGDTIEIRQVFDIADWPDDARKAADSPTVTAAVEKHK